MRHLVSVVIPARDEAPTVGAIVRAAASVAHEVIVVDDGSTDATAQLAASAGARVVTATAGPGKGQALRQGVDEATGEIVVFVDADLTGFEASWVTRLAEALAADDRLALVRATYRRAGEGGRVTELVARPVLATLFPEVAHLAQPLGGEYAAWRDVLQQLPFVHGYGVEMGLLVDVADRYGPEAIGEVDLGVRHHRSRPLDELRPQAELVLRVALDRAGLPGLSVAQSPPLAAEPRRRRPA